MVPESRVIANLLLKGVDRAGWKQAIEIDNVLRKRSPATAATKAILIRARLKTMTAGLWRLVRDGALTSVRLRQFAVALRRGDRRALVEGRPGGPGAAHLGPEGIAREGERVRPGGVLISRRHTGCERRSPWPPRSRGCGPDR